MLSERTDRHLSFYKLKRGEGLSHEETLAKVIHKFTTSDSDLVRLYERLASSEIEAVAK